MHQTARAAGLAVAAAATRPGLREAGLAPRARFDFICRDAHGRERWRESADNLITDEGLDFCVDTLLKASGYTAAWYLLLKGSGSAAAGDTLASHAGWSEITAYSGNRPAITWGTTADGENACVAVEITFTGTYTVAGAGICTVASGTSGTLYNVADFGTPRSGGSGDTLTVTVTISLANPA